jgi:hypothetical protein
MRIFLSYRREDSSAWAGRLRDVLASRVGEENVFQDVTAVRPGQDFRAAIDGALGRSDAVLAVIGPHWLTAASADGLRHLTDEHDHVRAELSAALRLGGLIVPVLVGRATMPNPEQLPDDLKPLAVLQAVTLSDETWNRDVEDLLEAIGVESHPARTRRMIIAVGAVLAVVAVVALAILVRSDGDDGSSADSATTPPTLKPQCPAPAVSDEWDGLTTSDSGEIGTSDAAIGRVAVVDAQFRPSETGSAWDVVFSIDYTALTESFQSQYWPNYELTAGGLTFDPRCFSVTGGEISACCGEVTEVLVAFDSSVDPIDGAALLVDGGGFGTVGRLDFTAR